MNIHAANSAKTLQETFPGADSDAKTAKARELADKFNSSQRKNGEQRISEYVAAKTPDDTLVTGKYSAETGTPAEFADKLRNIEEMLNPNKNSGAKFGGKKATGLDSNVKTSNPGAEFDGKKAMNSDSEIKNANTSPEFDNKINPDGKKTDKITGEISECQTCANRKYVDVSDDNSVSFQIPTKISKNEAEAKVRAHENEHVFHEQAKAAEEGKRIVSQSVEIKTAVCPECGDSYVAGGETETVTANKRSGDVDNADGENGNKLQENVQGNLQGTDNELQGNMQGTNNNLQNNMQGTENNMQGNMLGTDNNLQGNMQNLFANAMYNT